MFTFCQGGEGICKVKLWFTFFFLLKKNIRKTLINFLTHYPHILSLSQWGAGPAALVVLQGSLQLHIGYSGKVSAVQCSAVQCSAVQCSLLNCTALQ